MKIALALSLFLLSYFTFGDKSFSLTDYQIEKTCKTKKRKSICINNLKKKRSDLQKGYQIEIPVIPYKG
tara:strand:- start:236 stop:442 length:207 start_codon:yes stop_codon:yes gene_type:complete